MGASASHDGVSSRSPSSAKESDSFPSSLAKDSDTTGKGDKSFRRSISGCNVFPFSSSTPSPRSSSSPSWSFKTGPPPQFRRRYGRTRYRHLNEREIKSSPSEIPTKTKPFSPSSPLTIENTSLQEKNDRSSHSALAMLSPSPLKIPKLLEKKRNVGKHRMSPVATNLLHRRRRLRYSASRTINSENEIGGRSSTLSALLSPSRLSPPTKEVEVEKRVKEAFNDKDNTVVDEVPFSNQIKSILENSENSNDRSSPLDIERPWTAFEARNTSTYHKWQRWTPPFDFSSSSSRNFFSGSSSLSAGIRSQSIDNFEKFNEPLRESPRFLSLRRPLVRRTHSYAYQGDVRKRWNQLQSDRKLLNQQTSRRHQRFGLLEIDIEGCGEKIDNNVKTQSPTRSPSPTKTQDKILPTSTSNSHQWLGVDDSSERKNFINILLEAGIVIPLTESEFHAARIWYDSLNRAVYDAEQWVDYLELKGRPIFDRSSNSGSENDTFENRFLSPHLNELNEVSSQLNLRKENMKKPISPRNYLLRRLNSNDSVTSTLSGPGFHQKHVQSNTLTTGQQQSPLSKKQDFDWLFSPKSNVEGKKFNFFSASSEKQNSDSEISKKLHFRIETIQHYLKKIRYDQQRFVSYSQIHSELWKEEEDELKKLNLHSIRSVFEIRSSLRQYEFALKVQIAAAAVHALRNELNECERGNLIDIPIERILWNNTTIQQLQSELLNLQSKVKEAEEACMTIDLPSSQEKVLQFLTSAFFIDGGHGAKLPRNKRQMEFNTIICEKSIIGNWINFVWNRTKEGSPPSARFIKIHVNELAYSIAEKFHIPKDNVLLPEYTEYMMFGWLSPILLSYTFYKNKNGLACSRRDRIFTSQQKWLSRVGYKTFGISDEFCSSQEARPFMYASQLLEEWANCTIPCKIIDILLNISKTLRTEAADNANFKNTVFAASMIDRFFLHLISYALIGAKISDLHRAISFSHYFVQSQNCDGIASSTGRIAEARIILCYIRVAAAILCSVWDAAPEMQKKEGGRGRTDLSNLITYGSQLLQEARTVHGDDDFEDGEEEEGFAMQIYADSKLLEVGIDTLIFNDDGSADAENTIKIAAKKTWKDAFD
eukprot:g4556.t1